MPARLPLQVGLDRDRRFKQGHFECLVACTPGAQRPPPPGRGADRAPGAAVPPLFKWLVQRDLQVGTGAACCRGDALAWQTTGQCAKKVGQALCSLLWLGSQHQRASACRAGFGHVGRRCTSANLRG